MRCHLAASLAFALAFASALPAQAQGTPPPAAATQSQEVADAPFGLSWGASKAQVESLGVNLAETQQKDYGKGFAARNLPRALSDLDEVYLFFGHDDRLWRIVAATKSFDNDPFGGGAQTRYKELSALLDDRYGKGKVTHRTPDNQFMRDPNEFVFSLKAGERWHFTNWNAKGVDIELSIRAEDTSTSYLLLIYASDAEEALFQKADKAKQKDAL